MPATAVTQEQVEERVIEAIASFGPDRRRRDARAPTLRGARRRLARPRRARADRRGRVRRRDRVDDMRGPQDRRRRRRPGGGARVMSRRSPSPASAPSRRWASAPDAARALGRRASAGIEDGLGRCREFDPAEFMSAKEARRTDRFTQLAVAACGEALEEAGWDGEPPYEPGARRLRDRHRHRRHRHDRGRRTTCCATSGAERACRRWRSR